MFSGAICGTVNAETSPAPRSILQPRALLSYFYHRQQPERFCRPEEEKNMPHWRMHCEAEYPGRILYSSVLATVLSAPSGNWQTWRRDRILLSVQELRLGINIANTLQGRIRPPPVQPGLHGLSLLYGSFVYHHNNLPDYFLYMANQKKFSMEGAATEQFSIR